MFLDTKVTGQELQQIRAQIEGMLKSFRNLVLRLDLLEKDLKRECTPTIRVFSRVRPGEAVKKSAASAASLDGFSSRDQVGC